MAEGDSDERPVGERDRDTVREDGVALNDGLGVGEALWDRTEPDRLRDGLGVGVEDLDALVECVQRRLALPVRVRLGG